MRLERNRFIIIWIRVVFFYFLSVAPPLSCSSSPSSFAGVVRSFIRQSHGRVVAEGRFGHGRYSCRLREASCNMCLCVYVCIGEQSVLRHPEAFETPVKKQQLFKYTTFSSRVRSHPDPSRWDTAVQWLGLRLRQG